MRGVQGSVGIPVIVNAGELERIYIKNAEDLYVGSIVMEPNETRSYYAVGEDEHGNIVSIYPQWSVPSTIGQVTTLGPQAGTLHTANVDCGERGFLTITLGTLEYKVPVDIGPFCSLANEYPEAYTFWSQLSVTERKVVLSAYRQAWDMVCRASEHCKIRSFIPEDYINQPLVEWAQEGMAIYTGEFKSALDMINAVALQLIAPYFIPDPVDFEFFVVDILKPFGKESEPINEFYECGCYEAQGCTDVDLVAEQVGWTENDNFETAVGIIHEATVKIDVYLRNSSDLTEIITPKYISIILPESLSVNYVYNKTDYYYQEDFETSQKTWIQYSDTLCVADNYFDINFNEIFGLSPGEPIFNYAAHGTCLDSVSENGKYEFSFDLIRELRQWEGDLIGANYNNPTFGTEPSSFTYGSNFQTLLEVLGVHQVEFSGDIIFEASTYFRNNAGVELSSYDSITKSFDFRDPASYVKKTSPI